MQLSCIQSKLQLYLPGSPLGKGGGGGGKSSADSSINGRAGPS